MILGTVTEDGVPLVWIEIGGRSFPAIIDTGFNGDLEIPVSLRSHFQLEWLFRAKSLLAGGVTIDDDVFRIHFPFDGRLLEVEATFVDSDEILVGTRLLRSYRLTINFGARTLRLQKLKKRS